VNLLRRIWWVGAGAAGLVAVSLVALFVAKRVLADDQGCLPVLSASELGRPFEAQFGKTVYRSVPMAIDSVIGSSSVQGRVYATTYDRHLYRGEGSPLRWHKVSALIPGELVAAAGTPETIYAAKRALYKSDDRGSSWTRLSCGLILNDVAIPRQRPSTIYLAADTVDHASRVLGGLYRTTDGGQSWKRFTNFPKPNPHEPVVGQVAVDPESPQTVFISAPAGGVHRSADGGRHWRFSPIARGGLGLDGLPILSLAFGPGPKPTLWAGSHRGVWRSDATGRRWSRPGAVTRRIDRVLDVVPDPLNPTLLFGISVDGPVRTVDGGRHWSRIAGLPKAIWGLTVAIADGSVYAWDSYYESGGRTIFRSRDHGVTWPRLPRLPRKP
jgi:hypothetical protein